MSAGALDHLTDLAGEPVRNISVELLRFLGSRARAARRSMSRSPGPTRTC